ncbi:hypothetical protein [Pelagicoccus sp. SDUM812002]|uniref:hypothetical protein n=1 Tax=Pelagicoccus sp. SDUM812002 TaxID=3041266 RepID=UPI00280DF5FF|nr:hypothetical protein [Pelagicoccus sp. SDUM812002]MDQ8184218.1 hypothetical protein [Pelagicoccus sp. SDUM812002]
MGWIQSQVAFAGTHLYSREEHYAGGIAIDPQDTDTLYLSSEVDPQSGQPNLTGRYQIFHATRSQVSWNFLQLTFDASQDNIRPVISRNHDFDTVALWLQGRYTNYEDYKTRVVGVIEKAD